MARLPSRYAPFLYGVVQAALTTAVATGVATHQTLGFDAQFLHQWAVAWWYAWLAMLPVVVVFAPLIQRAVTSVTAPDAMGEGKPGEPH